MPFLFILVLNQLKLLKQLQKSNFEYVKTKKLKIFKTVIFETRILYQIAKISEIIQCE